MQLQLTDRLQLSPMRRWLNWPIIISVCQVTHRGQVTHLLDLSACTIFMLCLRPKARHAPMLSDSHRLPHAHNGAKRYAVPPPARASRFQRARLAPTNPPPISSTENPRGLASGVWTGPQSCRLPCIPVRPRVAPRSRATTTSTQPGSTTPSKSPGRRSPPSLLTYNRRGHDDSSGQRPYTAR